MNDSRRCGSVAAVLRPNQPGSGGTQFFIVADRPQGGEVSLAAPSELR